MATYKALKGLSIRTIDGDASPTITGDIWYNSSAKKLKGAKIVAGTWAAGADVNNQRAGKMSGGHTVATAIIAGGGHPPGGHQSTETYDGTSWTELNNPSESHPQTSGGGTPAAAWMCVGTPGDTTSGEEWNGTSWSDANPCNRGNAQRAGSGPQTAAVMMGSEPATTDCESYDGTTWTEVANTPISHRGSECVGPNTAAKLLCGHNTATPAQTAETFDFNGSSFTAAPDTNTVRFEFGSLGLTQDACMCLGGTIDASGTTRTANAEEFDGTSWAEGANLENISAQSDGAGTSAAGIISHGYVGPYPGAAYSASTEEWTHGVGAVTFTSS